MLKIVRNDAPMFPGPPACCVGIDSRMVLSVVLGLTSGGTARQPGSGPEDEALPPSGFESTLESGHTEPALFPIFPKLGAILADPAK